MANRIKVMRHGAEGEEADARSMPQAANGAYTRSLRAVRNRAHTEKSALPTGQTALVQVRGLPASYGVAPVLHGIHLDGDLPGTNQGRTPPDPDDLPDGGYNAYSRHRVRELLGWLIRFYTGCKSQAPEDRIRELLRLIDMEPDKFIDRLPAELSGGPKQRIGIARALAAEPRLIICDEVTSALDLLVAEGILQLLDRLQKEFEPCLYVHNT